MAVFAAVIQYPGLCTGVIAAAGATGGVGVALPATTQVGTAQILASPLAPIT